MTLFKIAFLTLGVIFFVNLGDALVELNLRDPVYACKDVKILDPIDVRKLCKRRFV
jgi:hypothetical protein